MIVRGGLVVLPDGRSERLDILVRGERIAALGQPGTFGGSEGPGVDADGLLVLPGLVDPHVHFGISNRLEDDFASESRSAAQGGVTTVLSFNKTMASYHEVAGDWIEEAARSSLVDFGFHFGLFTEQHIEEIPSYVDDYGVTSFKFFMSYKGVEKQKFGSDTPLDDGYLLSAMRALAAHPLRPRICVHCENMEIVAANRRRYGPSASLADWNRTREGLSEAEAVSRAICFAEATGCRLYVVHLSAAESVQVVERHGLPAEQDDVIVETCPHYLELTATEGLDPSEHLAKVNPPVREGRDHDALWRGLAEGRIRTIGSDHVPRTLATKRGDGTFGSMTAGFPGLEVALPLLLTRGLERGLTVGDVARIFADEPARAFGLAGRKGRIEVGHDADLTLVDLSTERTVESDSLASSSGYSPYQGLSLRGWPKTTLSRGAVVWSDGDFPAAPGRGRYLRRDAQGSGRSG